MQHCPVCQGTIFIGLSGIRRCLNGHILSIPPEFTLAIDLNWSNGTIVLPPPERTPVDRIYQEAFREGELEV